VVISGEAGEEALHLFSDWLMKRKAEPVLRGTSCNAID